MRNIKHIAIPVASGFVSLIVGVGIGSSGRSTVVTKTVTSPAVTITAAPAPAVTVTETPSPSPMTVVKYSGTGNWNSDQFVLNGNPVTVTYSYWNNTDGYGGSNFIGDIQSSSDDQNFVNTIGTSGGTTTTVYPQQADTYHLSIQSTGPWTVTISESS